VIPDELVTMRSLRVAIAVGQVQAKGDPWRRFVVYFVAADRADVLAMRRVAARDFAWKRTAARNSMTWETW
jgi:hypothetical protein